uniref:vesicular, overexpressed in cancer, prosurvival protein 1 isoform X2 n=1 Tax=Doryrhamphus excisus TaxID=161450 RepID=UPI0025ADD33D|nr:vesicular, overexpressed in cancer, prosurvival protein 1 isoform X2 [Doryrhamphus excisus]
MTSIIDSNGRRPEAVEAKKYCWYFEGGYPIYFRCRSYEDCCGTRCCVRALSIQRLWYFWVLLMMAVLFCCGAGFFIRRRMYPSSLRDETAFNVSFTRHPVTSPGHYFRFIIMPFTRNPSRSPTTTTHGAGLHTEGVVWSPCTTTLVSFVVSQQPGSLQGFGVNRMTGADLMLTATHPAYPQQPGSAHMMMTAYPPPPSYCNHPPPSYDQIFHGDDKK